MEKNITFICEYHIYLCSSSQYGYQTRASHKLGDHNAISTKGYGNPFLRLNIKTKVSTIREC